MFTNFSQGASDTLKKTKQLIPENTEEIKPPYLLLGLLKSISEKEITVELLKNIDTQELQKKLETSLSLENPNYTIAKKAHLALETKEIIELATQEAKQLGCNFVGNEHLLLAFVHQNSTAAPMLKEQGLNIDHLRETLKEKQNSIHINTIAPWAKGKSFFWYYHFLCRLSLFFIGPAMVTAGCMITGQWELAVLVFIIMFVTGCLVPIAFLIGVSFFGLKTTVVIAFLTSIALTIKKIPLLKKLVEEFSELHRFYYQNKPKNIFYYFFYPITAPISMLFSPSSRQEAKIYSKLIFSLVIVVALDTLLYYPTYYPPYLNFSDAIHIIIFQIFSLLVIIVIGTLPMITTCFELNLEGRKFSLGILSAMGIFFLITCIVATVISKDSMQIPSVLSIRRLDLKLTKTKFKQDLQKYTQDFLSKHINKAPNGPENKVLFAHELTFAYQTMVKKITKKDENKGFWIIRFSVPGKNGQCWLGVLLRYVENGPAQLLYLMSPQKNFYTSWKTLPVSTKKMFRVKKILEAEQKYSPNIIKYKGLIEEVQALAAPWK